MAGGLFLAMLWEAAGRLSSSLLLPTFSETTVAFVRLATGLELWVALGTSNEALVVGFGAALVAGIPLGLFLGRSVRADAWLDPYLYMLLALPTTALVPLVLMTTGVGLASRALVVYLFSLPILVECARDGVRRADPRLREMAVSFGATAWQQWRKIVLPGALPGIMTGVRLGLARAVDGMVVVELVLVAVGVGRLLLDFQGRFEAPDAYAVVVAVMIEAVLLTHAGRVLERRLVPSRASH
jgi:NitT/TauT family transport system permease protein